MLNAQEEEKEHENYDPQEAETYQKINQKFHLLTSRYIRSNRLYSSPSSCAALWGFTLRQKWTTEDRVY